jgi:uncharacterized membrane protein
MVTAMVIVLFLGLFLIALGLFLFALANELADEDSIEGE